MSLFSKSPNKIETLLEQMIKQNGELSQKQIDVIDNQNKLIRLMESGFNSANLLSMKTTMDKIYESQIRDEQSLTELRAANSELIKQVTILSLTIGRMSNQRTQLQPELPIDREPQSIPEPQMPEPEFVTTDNKRKIIDLWKQGKSYAEIGRILGTSRQYVNRVMLEIFGDTIKKQHA